MKTFKDLLIDNKLEVGKEAYLNFKKGIYLGKDEEGYHQLEYIDKFSGQKKLLEYKGVPTVPQLPLGIYVKQKRTGNYGEIIDYVNFSDKMFYVVRIYADVFKEKFDETYQDLMNNYELVEGNPFKDVEEFIDELDDIDSEINTLLGNINSIKREIKQIEERRKSITKLCKHEWIKGEREEVSKGHFEQECECSICGETKLNKSYRLF